MDLRTWQEGGIRAGSYSARHRGRSPFSPLRPAPIAIGSLSTAAIAAFAFAAPGILHGGPGAAGSTVLDGAPNRIAPLAPGSGGNAAPEFLSVTAPTSSSSDSPAAPSSTAAAPGTTDPSSSPTPFGVRTPSSSASSSHPSQPQPTQSQPSPPVPTTPTMPTTPTTPTTPRTTPPPTPTPPTTPVTPPPTTTTTTPPFNSATAVSSALGEIGTARSRQGVSGLGIDSLLTKAARLHATDMARTGDFSHIGSDGSDPFSRAAGVGCHSLSQELIAHGKPGDDVVGALLRDPSSRRALLSFWNTTIGVSAQLDPATGDVYWTIELGWM